MPDMLTPQEVAVILGGIKKPVPVRTLAFWRKSGKGPPFVQIGRTIRYPDDGLKKFIEARTEQE